MPDSEVAMFGRPVLASMLVVTTIFSGCAGAPRTVSPTAKPTPLQPTATTAGMSTPRSAISPTVIPMPTTPAPILPDVGPFRFIAAIEAPPRSSEASLSLRPDGSLYAGIGNSLYVLNGQQWQLLTEDAPLPISGVDANGHAIAVSEETAAVWDGTSWTTYGPETGWEFDAFPWSLAPSPLFSSDGRTWVPGERTLRVFDGTQWQTYRYADLAMQPVEEDLFSEFSLAETGGKVWVGDCTFAGPGPEGSGGGARWFDGTTWHGAGSPAATGCVTEITVAPDGSLWLDVGPTLYHTDQAGANWKGWRLPKPPVDPAVFTPRFGEITDMAVDADGNVWLALTVCGGASCYGDMAAYRFDPASGIYTPLPFTIEETARMAFDRQGRGWLFSGRIFQMTESELTSISDQLQVGVVSVIQDKSGTIWVLGWVDDWYGLWVLE